MDSFDRETGEIELPTLNTSERAVSVASQERKVRREEAMGRGLVGIYGKLLKAHAKIAPVIGKETKGPRGNYTSLENVIRTVRKHLLDEGIIIRQGADRVFSMGDGTQKTFWVPIFTDLIDAATGEVVRTEVPMPIARPDPQAVGGVLSYGRRYTLLAALGIATGDAQEDDDAETAMPRDITEGDDAGELIREITATKTEAEAHKLKGTYHKRLQELAPEAYDRVKKAFQDHVKALRTAPAAEPAPPKKPKKVAEPVS